MSAAAPGRGRPRKIDRATVSRAALAIVDQDGLAGLTMRRVAEQLGVGLATLYNTATSKEVILDDMIDMVFGQLPAPDQTPGREVRSLVELWKTAHELLFQNPSVAQLTALKPAGGPGMLALMESSLALLGATGMEYSLRGLALTTVRSYTLGFTLLRISRSDPAATLAEQRLAEATKMVNHRYPELIAMTPELQRSRTSDQFVAGLTHLVQGFLPAQTRSQGSADTPDQKPTEMPKT